MDHFISFDLLKVVMIHDGDGHRTSQNSAFRRNSQQVEKVNTCCAVHEVTNFEIRFRSYASSVE